MKSVALFVLLAVAGCVAQDQFLAYAGTTSNAPTFFYPTWSAGNCAAYTAEPSPYVTFSNTFATSGVREIAAVAEDEYESSFTIFVYAGGFDPSNPCTNVVGTEDLGNYAGQEGGPDVDHFLYFTANVNYTFVITSSDTDGGWFAINVFLYNATGLINGGDGSTWWPTPYISDGVCQNYPSQSAPAGWYTWTQPTSGWFDIVAIFANLTQDPDVYGYGATAALYEGTPSLTGLANDPCNNTATSATFWVLTHTSERGTLIANVNLTAGVTYTAVFSTGFADYWSLEIIPTRLRSYQNATGFIAPTRGSEASCTSSNGDPVGWDSYVFTATQSSAFFVATQYPPDPWNEGGDDSSDTWTYLYNGVNAGTFGVGGTAPATCPSSTSLLDDGETGIGYIVWYYTTAGQSVTAVITSYYSDTFSEGNYYLWTFSGAPIGNFATTTSTGATTTTGTSTSTTGTSTTGSTTSPTPAPTPAPTNAPTPTSAPTPTGAPTPAPTTSAPTPTVTAKAPTPAPNSTITSTSTTGSKPATSTTSGASTVAVGVVVVVAAVAALL